MKACIDGAGANGGWLGERLQTLADTLPRGGIDVEGTDCIQKGIWFKLRGNLTINPISARTGATTDRILDDDLVRGFVSAVMLEAKAIGEKLGLPIRFVGVGEKIDDLIFFSATDFAEALLPEVPQHKKEETEQAGEEQA